MPDPFVLLLLLLRVLPEPEQRVVRIRLYLLDTVLHRLQQRAAANDPAWVTLKTRCDGLAGGTFYPPSGNAYPDFPNVAIAAGFSGHGFKFSTVVGEIMADLAIERRTALPIGMFGLSRFA